mgnify:CR=1 FL=1
MKIAINGFGRIGRQTLRAALAKNSELEIVAVNDLVPAETLAHLFEFDSVYGKFPGTVESGENFLRIDGRRDRVDRIFYRRKKRARAPRRRGAVGDYFRPGKRSRRHFRPRGELREF